MRHLDIGLQFLRFLPGPQLMALLEVGQDLLREELQRFADMLVLDVATLMHEDELIDSGLLERFQVCPHLVRASDAGAEEPYPGPVFLETIPEIRAPGQVDGSKKVVAESIREDLEAFEATR